MNRTQLLAFTAVAESKSFTRGAARIAVSQPAVSLQVAELEGALKTKLFDRLPRGVRLTKAGELLLHYARRIDSLEIEAVTAVAQLEGLQRGRLMLGASLTIGSYLLPEVIGRFRKQHPQIELQLEIANSSQIERLLAEDRIDLAFTEGIPAEGGRVEVIEDQLVLIAPRRHALRRSPRVTARLLCDDVLILRETGSGTREVIQDAFTRRGLTLSPLMSLGSTEAIKRAVRAGVGVAIVSEMAIADELKAKTLAVVKVADLSIRRPLHLRRPVGRSDSAAATALLAMIQSHA